MDLMKKSYRHLKPFFFNVVKPWEYNITTDTIVLILLQKFIRQIVNAQSNTLLYSRSVSIIIPRVKTATDI